jgi:hypothetical protein
VKEIDTAPPDARPDGRGAVVVNVRGTNGLGDHVSGTVRVLLPLGAGPIR